MKRIAVILAMVFAASSSAQADIIAQWTFESSVPTTAGPHLAEGGANAGTSGAVAVGLNTISNPAGNGSAESFSGNGWDIGDYFQFSTFTDGYENITLSWDQTGSGTGPAEFTVAYSTDGLNFTNFSDYTVVNNTNPPGFWNSTTAFAAYNLFADLSAVTSLDDSIGVISFRLINRSTLALNGGTVGGTGTSRIDNFTISGDLLAPPPGVPEPSSMALSGIAFAGLTFARRRKARAKAAQA